MKKMTVYEVYMDDGKTVIKATIPAESKRAAAQYAEGNGEIIKVRQHPFLQSIDLECLAETLRRAQWGQAEMDVIIRTLQQAGLERVKGEMP